MSNQVITIGYLKSFVSGIVSVSTSQPDTYCPTYSELTSGSMVINYKQASNPKDTTNGVYISGSYAHDQLVIREDLELKWMVLQSINITASPMTISCCGGSSSLSTSADFKLNTKVEGGNITEGGTETDTSVPANLTDSASYTSLNGKTLTFEKNRVNGEGTSSPSSVPSRSSTVTFTYSYSGVNKSDNVTVTQGANTVGGWYRVESEDYSTSLDINCPSGLVSEDGGSVSVTSVLHYMGRSKADDSCSTIVGLKYDPMSKTGPSQTVSFTEQDCDEEERCESVTLSLSGQSNSCQVCQEESSVTCYTGESGCGSCPGEIHWLRAEKKGPFKSITGAKIVGELKCDGGIATVEITGENRKEWYTRKAECESVVMGCTVVSSLPTVGSPGTVYLQESYTGETSEQYYTAYTGSHYELYNNNGEAAYRWSGAGSARKYSGKYWSCSCCGYGYITSESEWDECNDPNSWTSGTTGMNGYTSDSGYFEDEEDPDFTSQSICTISYVSDAADYFVSAKTSPYTEIQTFEYEPNLTVKDEEREITFTSNNPGQGQASFTLKYIVPKCVDRTQVYDFSKIEYNGGDVDCKTTKVSFTIEGETKFLEISQKPNEEGKYESGYTESSAYTVSEGTDYTVSYSPSDINNTDNDRVITVSIIGIGKFAGKGGSFSYTQKKCTGGTGTTCTVTSISADKTTVGVSEPTSITVNGTGTCTLQWDSGDGCTTGSFASAVPGTYTICSCDDSSKCVTVTVTSTTCSITSISADKTTIGINESTEITIEGTGNDCQYTWKDGDSSSCQSGSFSSSNVGSYTICSCDDSSKCVTITVTGNSCTEGTEYQISVTANTIDKCATSGSLIVKERSRTVNADCSTSEWSSWADTTAYTAQYTPNITANETTAETNYSVTVTSTHDKDVTASDTFKQNAGPCSGDVYVFEWVDAISADETNSVSESETQTKTINLRQSNLRKERNIIL